MSRGDREPILGERAVCGSGPSEPQSHIEHRAALDATLFRLASDPDELVFELEAGELRLRGSADAPDC